MKIIKGIFITILILLFIGGVFVAGIGMGAWYILMPPGGGKTAVIDIPQGETGSAVAEKLEKAEIIRDARLFKIVMKVTNSAKDIKPGKYELNQNMTMMEILHRIKTGEGKIRLITIPEGLTLKEIAGLLEEKKIVSRNDFLSAAADNSFFINGNKVDSIEGYLLPDTYDFPARFTAGDIIKRLMKEFDDRAVPLYIKLKDKLPRKMTLKEIVILASLIEREAQVPSERPVIASVYYNRLKKGMKLQCDATVQFALGKQKEVLKYSDLEVKSPYNTYLHEGLPPGPIANPGLESIKAALQPETTNYLFYVRNDVKNDGSHIFSRTLSEHNSAIVKYQK